MDGDLHETHARPTGGRGRSTDRADGGGRSADGVGAKRKRPSSASASGSGKPGGSKRPTGTDPAEKPRKLDTARFLRGGEDSKVAKATTDLKLKAQIKRRDKEYREAAMDAARSELLLTEEAG